MKKILDSIAEPRAHERRGVRTLGPSSVALAAAILLGACGSSGESTAVGDFELSPEDVATIEDNIGTFMEEYSGEPTSVVFEDLDPKIRDQVEVGFIIGCDPFQYTDDAGDGERVLNATGEALLIPADPETYLFENAAHRAGVEAGLADYGSLNPFSSGVCNSTALRDDPGYVARDAWDQATDFFGF